MNNRRRQKWNSLQENRHLRAYQTQECVGGCHIQKKKKILQKRGQLKRVIITSTVRRVRVHILIYGEISSSFFPPSFWPNTIRIFLVSVGLFKRGHRRSFGHSTVQIQVGRIPHERVIIKLISVYGGARLYTRSIRETKVSSLFTRKLLIRVVTLTKKAAVRTEDLGNTMNNVYTEYKITR
jgi:hypothetical protein